MNSNQQQVLVNIANSFNRNNIVWGVGASMLLFQYGLVSSPSDIDIVVASNQIAEASSLLSLLGTLKRQKEKSDIYLTDFFYEYTIDSVDVDIIAGFKIRHPESVFEYEFSEKSVPHFFEINKASIPFMTLEDWYVLYQLMPEREYKVSLIEDYFENNQIEYPYLLEYSVQHTSLPSKIKERITRWIV